MDSPDPPRRRSTRKGSAPSASHLVTPKNRQADRPGASLLRQREAAEYLGVSPRTLRRLVELGQLPSVRFGTGGRESVRFESSDLDCWIASKKEGGPR